MSTLISFSGTSSVPAPVPFEHTQGAGFYRTFLFTDKNGNTVTARDVTEDEFYFKIVDTATSTVMIEKDHADGIQRSSGGIIRISIPAADFAEFLPGCKTYVYSLKWIHDTNEMTFVTAGKFDLLKDKTDVA